MTLIYLSITHTHTQCPSLEDLSSWFDSGYTVLVEILHEWGCVFLTARILTKLFERESWWVEHRILGLQHDPAMEKGQDAEKEYRTGLAARVTCIVAPPGRYPPLLLQPPWVLWAPRDYFLSKQPSFSSPQCGVIVENHLLPLLLLQLSSWCEPVQPGGLCKETRHSQQPHAYPWS